MMEFKTIKELEAEIANVDITQQARVVDEYIRERLMVIKPLKDVLGLIDEDIKRLKAEHKNFHPVNYATCEHCGYYKGRIKGLEELKKRING